MQILIVPDSFKGSTTSPETAECIASGLRAVFPDCVITALPAADGGEGTTEAVVTGAGGEYLTCTAQDPLGRPVKATFGLLPDRTAVIEMAQASGLPLLKPEERDPAVTTTYGTGEMIRAALDMGCRRILVGIGGSATNDGGTGMAAALGVRFLDKDGKELAPGGLALAQLDKIDISGLDPRLKETELLVASDVTNPLCGPKGASAVYGPQKGASPELVEKLDAALARYGEVLKGLYGTDYAALPGAGAAGGLGTALMSFCGGTLRPGIDIIFDLIGLEKHIADADLIVTGEGRVDATSANGKLLGGVGTLARKYGKPVIAVCGGVGPGYEKVYDLGVSAVLPIANGPITLEESLANAPALIRETAERAARLIALGGVLPLNR